jgi:signal transduction histidine kinase
VISPLAASLYAIAALGIALGLFAHMSFRAERDNPYRFFAGFIWAISIENVGTAMLTDAVDAASGSLAQRVQLVGQALALLAYVDFQQRASRDEAPRVRLGMRLLALAIVAVAASGLMLEPGTLAPAAAWALPGAIQYPEVPLSPLGHGTYVVAVLIVMRGLWKIHGALDAEVSRPIFFSFVLAFLAVLHDEGIRLGLFESIYLLGFASLASMLVVSTARARRFARDRRELQRRSQELERSHAQLRATRDELIHTRRLAAIGELSAVIAHEVRNPLAVIRNAASSLRRRDGLEEATRKHLLGIVDEESQRLSRLVSDMLVYAKPLHLHRHPQAALELAHAAIARARTEPGVDSNVPVEIVGDGAAQGGLVDADAGLLLQALANVLSNALRASTSEQPVELRMQRIDDAHGAALELIVSDQGPGMDAYTRGKAKDPFFTTRPRGTGLGLAIAERVAQAHGGELNLDSGPGRGTRARMRLPLLTEHGPAAARAPTPATDHDAVLESP